MEGSSGDDASGKVLDLSQRLKRRELAVINGGYKQAVNKNGGVVGCKGRGGGD